MSEDTGERIEERRIIRGESLESLSQAANVGKGHLSEIERGMKSPTVRLLRRIADALECPPSDLV